MIKKLRRKFIIIIMSILIVVFGSILTALNLLNYQSGEMQSKNFMNVLADNNGRIPIAKPNPAYLLPKPESRPNWSGNLISVLLDNKNAIIKKISSNDSAANDLDLGHIIPKIISKNKNFGKIASYHYLIKVKPYGNIVVFMDDSMEKSQSKRLLNISYLISVISLILLFFVSLFLSQLIVKPVEESFNKQKQFISDASHELKTPLSVISVNADVLENEVGSSKWLGFIKSETYRMSGLVNQLLSIARLEGSNRPLTITDFDISKAVYQILLPFESTAFEQKKSYTYDIEDSIHYNGDEECIKQMVAILIDNAIKYSNTNGSVHVLLKRNSSKIILDVFNTGRGIDPSEQDKIFERFYCSDYSRSRENGGYGLGLSIAKSIIEAHHGKISVQSKKGEGARFVVIL